MKALINLLFISIIVCCFNTIISGCFMFSKYIPIQGEYYYNITYFSKDRTRTLKAFVFAESEASLKVNNSFYFPQKPNVYYIFVGDSISKLDSLLIDKPKISDVTINGIDFVRRRYVDPLKSHHIDVYIKDGKVHHMVAYVFKP